MPFLLVILLIALRIPYFHLSILPRHDTFIAYSTFYYFYNHLYYAHSLPGWMPKITYGIPSLFFQFFSLSPLSYCFLLIGKIMGVTNPMLLFKLTVFTEELVLILGVYFLGRRYFQRRSIAAAVSIGAMISLESYTNIFFNLRIIYFLPWALLFLWRFVEKGEERYFWALLLVFVLGAMGNGIYIPIMLFYLGLAMAAVLLVRRPRRISELWPRHIGSRLTAVMVVVLIMVYGLVMWKSSKDLSLLIRDSHPQNTIDTFITYGGTTDIGQIFTQMFLMDKPYATAGAGFDNTMYVGMLVGIFFMVALWYCRDVFFCSLLAGLIFMILFSSGGLFSRLCYFLPGMSLFRHIGLSGPVIKLLVLIGAGFGLKHLFEHPRPTRLLLGPLLLWAVIIEGQDSWHNILNVLHILNGLEFLAVGLFLGLVCFYWFKPWGFGVKVALIVVFIAQALIFQTLLRANYPMVDLFFPAVVKSFNQVRSPLFDITRLDRPPDVRAVMMSMVQKSGRGCNYVTMFNTFDFDTCHTDVRVDLVNKSVLKTWKASQDQTEANYAKIVGCDGHPKCALLRQLPSYAGSDIDAQAIPFEANVIRFDPDQAVFKITAMAQPGWFYYADAFHPGWKAWVDGVETPIQQTADGFKAVAIGPQAQSIEFHFFDITAVVLQYLLCVGAIIGLGLLLTFRL